MVQRRQFLSYAALSASIFTMIDNITGNKISTRSKIYKENGPQTEKFSDFRYRLDSSTNNLAPGGWWREASANEFKISTGITGIHMFLAPGASRELHWHSTVAEWGYVVKGQCQSTIIAAKSLHETNNFGSGDIWYFPEGYSHMIQNIGNEPCHLVLCFNNGYHSESKSFSARDWINITSEYVLKRSLNNGNKLLLSTAKINPIIQSGSIIQYEKAVENPFQEDRTHKFSSVNENAQVRNFAGGSIRVVTAKEFLVSQKMSGGTMLLNPGAVYEMHWHPSSNEWQYFLSGTGRITLFIDTNNSKTIDFLPGDIAYIPAGFGHSIQNIGDDDLKTVFCTDSGDYREVLLRDCISAVPIYGTHDLTI